MTVQNNLKTIGIVTTSRADYGIYYPILKKLDEFPSLNLKLFVAGMHLSNEFGKTIDTIHNDGFIISEKVEMLLASDTPDAISKSIGMGTISFSQCFSNNRPDILLVLGDRFEMYSAVIAALPYNIPIAHIHGGEITQGAIDDVIRHSITKHSHLHFVSTTEYAKRVYQMGEEKWRIIISGAPSIDNLKLIKLLNKNELENRLNIVINNPVLLITFHPVTLEYDQTQWQINELLASIKNFSNYSIIFTFPNADTNGRIIINQIRHFVNSSTNSFFIDNLGSQAYFSLMNLASAMIGNSSSGIIESASFKLPVVNIGTRQSGRIKGKNVIDVDYNHENIVNAIKKATHQDFINSLRNINNQYGDGDAAEKILNKLNEKICYRKLLCKKFQDW